MRCDAEGCTSDAVSWLRFAGMGDIVHAHVCGPHEAEDREWADVVAGGPLPCLTNDYCSTHTEALFVRQPPLLEP